MHAEQWDDMNYIINIILLYRVNADTALSGNNVVTTPCHRCGRLTAICHQRLDKSWKKTHDIVYCYLDQGLMGWYYLWLRYRSALLCAAPTINERKSKMYT